MPQSQVQLQADEIRQGSCERALGEDAPVAEGPYARLDIGGEGEASTADLLVACQIAGPTKMTGVLSVCGGSGKVVSFCFRHHTEADKQPGHPFPPKSCPGQGTSQQTALPRMIKLCKSLHSKVARQLL